MAVNLSKGILDYTFYMMACSLVRRIEVLTLPTGVVITRSYPSLALAAVMPVQVNRFPGLHADTVAEIVRSVDSDMIIEEYIWED
jgi:hypothetical protein